MESLNKGMVGLKKSHEIICLKNQKAKYIYKFIINSSSR